MYVSDIHYLHTFMGFRNQKIHATAYLRVWNNLVLHVLHFFGEYQIGQVTSFLPEILSNFPG